jgi:hypothetical protein
MASRRWILRGAKNAWSRPPMHTRGSGPCVSGWVTTAGCRCAGAERSMFRWLPSTPLDRPVVTGEGHVVALENGGG